MHKDNKNRNIKIFLSVFLHKKYKKNEPTDKYAHKYRSKNKKKRHRETETMQKAAKTKLHINTDMLHKEQMPERDKRTHTIKAVYNKKRKATQPLLYSTSRLNRQKTF